jgi:SAM-dependent methyltransferase
MTDITQRAQQQFDTHAAGYLTSRTHADGPSLHRLREVLPGGPYHRMLDVATGGGHTARALHAEQVIMGDVAHGMLRLARQHTGLPDACQHSAGALPFAAGSFDLITCRTAAHHFPDVERFMQEGARTLRQGGVLAVVDNVVSGTPKVGAWLNAFEKLRDPSHHRCYTLDDWTTFFFQVGLKVLYSDLVWKRLAFTPWVERSGTSAADRSRLLIMLEQPPTPVAEWLQPERINGDWWFSIAEVVVVGQLN